MSTTDIFSIQIGALFILTKGTLNSIFKTIESDQRLLQSYFKIY